MLAGAGDILQGDIDKELLRQGECLLDGGSAANELMDAGIFIWAASQRCGREAHVKSDILKCEIDVASAIESVNAMINVILKAFYKCGTLKTLNPGCGLAVSKLTQSSAGIAAAVGGLMQKCPDTWPNGTSLQEEFAPGFQPHDALKWKRAFKMPFQVGIAMCVLDAKDSLKSLMKAIKAITTVKEQCAESGRECTANVFRIIGAFAGLGEFLAGAVGHCRSTPKSLVHCGSEIAMLVHHLTVLAEAGTVMSKHCNRVMQVIPIVPFSDSGQKTPSQLYDEDLVVLPQRRPSTQPSKYVTVLLAAMIPATAVMSFVGGRVFGNHRLHTGSAHQVLAVNSEFE